MTNLSWCCLLLLPACATAATPPPAQAPTPQATEVMGAPPAHADNPSTSLYDPATGKFRGDPREKSRTLDSTGAVEGGTRSVTLTQVNPDGSNGVGYRITKDSPNSGTITRINADGSKGPTIRVSR